MKKCYHFHQKKSLIPLTISRAYLIFNHKIYTPD
jgi:hypothetical protein